MFEVVVTSPNYYLLALRKPLITKREQSNMHPYVIGFISKVRKCLKCIYISFYFNIFNYQETLHCIKYIKHIFLKKYWKFTDLAKNSLRISYFLSFPPQIQATTSIIKINFENYCRNLKLPSQKKCNYEIIKPTSTKRQFWRWF